MEAGFAGKVKAKVQELQNNKGKFGEQNPFGVPISRGGWAGNGGIIEMGIANYFMHKAFPEIVSPDLTFNALEYIYGCHPGSDISFVSGVGTVSKKVAYGNNRADYTFIAGGIVPGVLILPPDFPENKEDWPFLWGENEYVINVGSSYILLVHAAMDLLNETSVLFLPGFNKIESNPNNNVKYKTINIGMPLCHFNIRISKRSFGFSIDKKPPAQPIGLTNSKIEYRS